MKGSSCKLFKLSIISGSVLRLRTTDSKLESIESQSSWMGFQVVIHLKGSLETKSPKTGQHWSYFVLTFTHQSTQDKNLSSIRQSLRLGPTVGVVKNKTWNHKSQQNKYESIPVNLERWIPKHDQAQMKLKVEHIKKNQFFIYSVLLISTYG